MNVVLYMRYSSDRQNEQSIEGQRRVCMQYCKANGYTVIEEYVDRALSAAHDTAKRIDFMRMIEDSEKQRFEGVVVYKLDRFARNRYDSAIYKNRLKKNGVRVISATENISDNPEGILLESVLEGMAEFYSKELAQKINRGLHESALKGQHLGGSTPLGYKVEGKHLVIDPVTAPYVVEAFERYADGDTVAAIIEDFNNRGYRTNKGCKFNKNSFKSVFPNERYLGIYKYKDVRIEGGVPQIIDQELFDKVQKRLKKNAEAPARGTAKVDYLLSQKLFCGHCGKHMNGESGTGKQGVPYHYYACYGHKHHSGCTKKNIKKDVIEKAVLAQIVGLLNEETIEYLADLAYKVYKEDEKENTRIPALREKLGSIQSAINRLVKMVEQGVESPTVVERLTDLEKEKRAVEKQLLEEKQVFYDFDKDQAMFWLSKFAKGDLDDPSFQRILIEMLVNAVFVYDDPDGKHTTLDIAVNLLSHRHIKVTLSDIYSGGGSTLSANTPPMEYKSNPYFVCNKFVVVYTVRIPNRA